MQYTICSQEYSSDYKGVLASEYRIRFQLPENHKTVAVTLNAKKVGAFLEDATVAAEHSFKFLEGQPLAPIPESPLYLDALQDGMDFTIAIINPDPEVYSIEESIASYISKHQYKTYMIRTVRYDGTISQQEEIPIGSTTLVISPDVEFLDVKSFLDKPDMTYVEGGGQGIEGKVSYDNLHELSDDSSAVLPENIPELKYLGDGGFSSTFRIEQNGDFYCSSSNEEYDANYPDGLVYTSEYMGKMKEITKISDTVLSMRSSETENIKESGTEWTENNVRYMYMATSGRDNIAYKLCMPGTLSSDIPEDVKSLIKKMTGKDVGESLTNYVLYETTTMMVYVNF